VHFLTACLAALAATAMPATAQVDPAAQDKVVRFVGAFAAGANVRLDPDVRIEITFVDLNRDGAKEALVIIRDPTWCGTRGCSAFALDLSGPDARSVGDFTAHELSPLGTVSNGWHDVTLGSGRFVFDGARYRFAGP
jgi:hypothetical protein